jgi:hypothetical protein
MPYLPARLTAVTTLADLKISGILSADSINHKIAMNSSAGAATDANDHFLFEDGGTDGGGKNAGDNLLLEDVTTANVPFANINVGSSTSGQLLQSQGAGLAPSFATVSGAAVENFFIADNSSAQAIGTGAWTIVTFGVETLDQDSHFASNKFTAPSDGKYMFFCTHMYMEGSGSQDQRMALDHKNSSGVSQHFRSLVKSDTHEASMSGGMAIDMSAGDYVEMVVYHTKGSNSDLTKAQMFGWRIV